MDATTEKTQDTTETQQALVQLADEVWQLWGPLTLATRAASDVDGAFKEGFQNGVIALASSGTLLKALRKERIREETGKEKGHRPA